MLLADRRLAAHSASPATLPRASRRAECDDDARAVNGWPYDAARLSIVIPAHDEGTLVARDARRASLAGAAPGEFEVVVVANGCTDDTAEHAARRYEHRRERRRDRRSLEDRRAQRRRRASRPCCPRIYVDADVDGRRRHAAGARRRALDDAGRSRRGSDAGRRQRPLVVAVRAVLPHLGAVGLPSQRPHRFGHLRGQRRRPCPLGSVPRRDRRRPLRAAALRCPTERITLRRPLLHRAMRRAT